MTGDACYRPCILATSSTRSPTSGAHATCGTRSCSKASTSSAPRWPPLQFWTIRCLEAHETHPRARILAARGPFTLEGERALFSGEAFDVVVSKNSGGSATEAKLEVARERGLPVVMLRRPELPAVDREFANVGDLLEALRVSA